MSKNKKYLDKRLKAAQFEDVVIRDSGISMDDSSSDMTSINRQSFNAIPSKHVLNRVKCFEMLASEKAEYHSNPNWWLDGRKDRNRVEIKIDRDDFEEVPSLEQQTSVSSQSPSRHSSESETPTTVPDVPEITYDDIDENEDNNQSISDDDVEAIQEPFIRQSMSRIRISRPASVTSQTSIMSTKLFNIIRELQENEQNYVRSLGNGIKNYMCVMDQNEFDNFPRTLRGQKFRVFGNILSIYKFHSDEFFPRLVECGEDVEQIAELFTSYVNKDFFYAYVIYAINRKKSELLCHYHNSFWKEVQNKCGDRLGINSFLLQPIQRLPRYQLLLNEIIKDLSKDLENTKQAIAACCVAEKNIQRLLDTVNESMSINDIRNCFDIDIFCQGKFKIMDQFQIYDWELRRRYNGKVFLFEQCLVYTEEIDREYLEFRGCYESEKLGIIYREGKNKFKLFAKKRGHKEVDFYGDHNTVIEWKNSITGMLMDFVAAEKKRNVSNSQIRKDSTIKLRGIPDSVRSSIMSNISNLSTGSNASFRSSASSGRGSLEPRQSQFSQWYV